MRSAIARTEGGATFQRGSRRRAGKEFTHVVLCNGYDRPMVERQKRAPGYYLPVGRTTYTCIVSWHTSEALAVAAGSKYDPQILSLRVAPIVGWES